MEQPPVNDRVNLHQRLRPVLESLQRFELMDSLHDRQQHQRPDVEAALLRRQQDAELARRLAPLNGADAAQLLEMLPGDRRYRVWGHLSHKAAGDALVEVTGQVAKDLVAATPESTLITILDALHPDQLSALKKYIAPDVLSRFKQTMAEQSRLQFEKSAEYARDTVGALMKHDFILVPVEFSVGDTIGALRERGPVPAQTDQVFVHDEFQNFLGSVDINDLLVEQPACPLQDILRKDRISFNPLDSGHHAALAFERYDLISAPVVDKYGHVQGRLTVETVMNYIRKQAEGQALASAGLRGDTDLFAPTWKGARERWPWLVINLFTALAATRFIAIFESTLEQLVSLAVLMPIIASVGGNTGNQTIALFVRGLALDQIKGGNTRFLLRKELSIGLINGALWGAVLGLVAALFYEDIGLGLVMMAAMILNLLVGATVGALVPLIAVRLGRDPAVGSSVLLTFTTDSMGFFIFLGLATVFLL
jgi:magnesium transporter